MARVGHVGGYRYHHHARIHNRKENSPGQIVAYFAILFAAIVFFVALVLYEGVDKTPHNTEKFVTSVQGGCVYDYANIYTADEIKELESAMEYFQEKTGVPVFIQTGKSKSGYSKKDLLGYYEIFDENHEDSLLIIIDTSRNGFDYVIGDNIDGTYVNRSTMQYLDKAVENSRDSSKWVSGLKKTANFMMKTD